MATLPPGGGRRRASSLGTGSSRSTTVVVGRRGRSSTIPTPVSFSVGSTFGFAQVSGIGDFTLTLDVSSFGTIEGFALVSAEGASFVDRIGTSAALATVTGVLEVPGGGGGTNRILQEIGDDLLLEDGSFMLREDGITVAPTTILDLDGFPITDLNGDNVLEV